MESLEPRVLLSADGLLAAATVVQATSHLGASGTNLKPQGGIVEQQVGDPSIASSAAAEVQSIFAGVAQAPIESPAPQAGSDSAGREASETTLTGSQNQTGTRASALTSFGASDSSAVSVNAGAANGNANPVTAQLVETLHVGNAPPDGGSVSRSFGSLSASPAGNGPTVVSDSINGGKIQRSLVTSIALTFSTDVSASLAVGDLVLHNITTGSNIAAASMSESYNSTSNTATWTFPNLPNKSLPGGNYLLEVRSATVTDVNGTPLASDFTDDFHVLTGDVSGHRVVNDLDLYRVWQNLLKPAAARDLNADLNGDGQVDASDLAVVKGNYLGKLPPSATFTLTSFTPGNGATDVGVTVRPEVFFSKPVDATTLTGDNFYASAGGQKLLTTIVPSNDGTYAWLFFSGTMPNASEVQVTVDGSTIRQRGTGTPLDADGDGVPGGTLTFSFSTVSLAPVVGTSLSGIVVDPGPDLIPRTDDDVIAGPNGYTFLHPIAGVKVYIIGLESQAQVTGADGKFHFNTVPVGDVKVAVDGMTATNPPAGYYFPNMVIDSTMTVGIDNQVMQGGQVGQEIYLARLKSSILNPINTTTTTTITATADAAPNLPPTQRQLLSVAIQPNSLIGANGQQLSAGSVGFSTVPPDLVTDMLPPGVLQHTFDLTIQAPGVSTFSTPAPMTFPNVFNAAPGSKLNFLSFDHTTGRLVIEGTATVSADGLSVVTDPGTGVTHPGWHGLTPPGDCGGSGGPPPPPPQPAPDTRTENAPIALPMISGENGNFPTLSWTAPDRLPDSPPPPPPPPGCGVPQQPPPDPKQPFIRVIIDVDGPLGDYMKKSGDLELTNQSFELQAGSGVTKAFGGDAKTYDELFGAGGFANLSRDQLYGSKVKVTTITGKPDGSTDTVVNTYFLYRWVDVIDANQAINKTGTTAAFLRTLADGTGGIVRNKNVDVHLESGAMTSFTTGSLLTTPFTYGGNVLGSTTAVWTFDPFLSGARSDTINIEADGLQVGSLTATGTATNATTINVNLDGYKAELKNVILALKNVYFPGADGVLGADGKDADDTVKTLYAYPGHTAYDPITINGPAGTHLNVYELHPGAKAGTDYVVVSNPFASEFAGYLPSDRAGAGPDGVLGTRDDVFTAAQLTSLNTFLGTEATALQTAVKAVYDPVNTAAGATGYSFVTSGGDVTMTWQDEGPGLYGAADFDVNQAALKPLLTSNVISEAAKEWALAEDLNVSVKNSGHFAVGINISWTNAAVTFAQFVTNTVAHEVGHTFGLEDAYLNNAGGGATNVNPPNDIMRAGNDADPALPFAATNVNLLRAALGMEANGDTPLQAELQLYRANWNLPDSAAGIRPQQPPGALFPELDVTSGGSDVFPNGTISFAPVAAGGAANTVNAVLTDTGLAPLTINTLTLSNGAASGFSIVNPTIAGTTLAVGQQVTLTLKFDPQSTGLLTDTLTIGSNAQSFPSYQIKLSGQAIPQSPTALVTLSGNNNLGGVALAGGTPVQHNQVFTITNDGASTLTISSFALAEGSGEFALLGLPANLSTTPIQLTLGQSFNFGVSFKPDKLGLQRALINIQTNDPTHSTLTVGATGTGLDKVVYPHWANDFIVIDTPGLAGSSPLRTVSDDQGNFQLFLPPNQFYHMVVFDKVTGLVAHSYGYTKASGNSINLTSSLVFAASTAQDTDYDGLPDDVEFAIGTSPTKADTDNSGIDDFTAVMEGLDPLGGRGFPTGVIASLALQGEATNVTVAGSSNNAQGQTAFVATGTYGLAIVDVTKFNKPVLTGQIQLPGDSTGVAVDLSRNLAVVANSSGLDFVDITNPMNPVLMKTLSLPLGAQSVQVFDGVAYTTSNTSLVSIDLASGQIIQTLNLGGQNLTDIARENSMLYTMDAGKTLRAVDISDFNMAAKGSLTLPDGGGKLFVGNGIAYVAATSNFRGGFDTVNVSDPNNLTLIAGSQVGQTNVAPGTAIVSNGSGLGIFIGSPSRTNANVLDLMNIADPTNTNAFLTRFNLPASPDAVTLAEGIAFVADGTSGLQVVNYLAFDTKGVAPTVSISTPVVDADPNTPGIQVVEGSSFPVKANVTDDVQVRNVELLVNGSVVTNDVSFPFDFVANMPKLTSSVTTVSIQVRATDTGGNTTLSNLLTYGLIKDTLPPAITGTNPTANQKIFFTPSIDFLFNKPLDASILNLAGATLTYLGADGVPGGGDDVNIALSSLQTRNLDRKLSLFLTNTLNTGNYQVTLSPTIISDRVGNHLTSPFTLPFSVRAASDVQALVGTPAVPRAPSANVRQEIGFYIPGATIATSLTFPTVDSNGNVSSRSVKASRIDAATSTAFFIVPDDATTGNITLPNDPNGPFTLQIVPTLVSLQASVGSSYYNSNLRLRGSGFVAGGVTINFGGQALASSSTSNPQVGYFYAMPNDGISLTVPNGVPFGPISVTTSGGTSQALNLTLSKIVSTATSGTPVDATQASANPGQAITLQGNGFDLTTNVLFPVIDGSGNITKRVVQPVMVDGTGTQLTVLVPVDALTGQVGIVGDRNNASVLLQVIPIILNADFSSVAGDGSSAQVRLHGAGFVKGNNSVYTFGATSVTDTTTPATSISVGYYYSQPNDGVNLTLQLSGNVYGPVTVKTAGGTSAPFTVGLSGIDNLAGTGLSVALSGTPADATVASANPGQAVTLVGSGLSANSAVVMQYIDSSGTVQTQLLRPTYANLAGTQATLVVPNQYNGAFTVHVVGASNGPVLQIVPLLLGVNVTGPDAVRLHGAGFVEGNNSVYNLGSGSVTDTSISSTPIDVYYGFSFDNDAANISNVPVSGSGVASVKTTGGTSATIPWGIINPDKGTLYDVAVEAGGNIWVASNTLITRINPGTGATLGSYSLPGGGSGNIGLQILGSAMSLFGVPVPAGSLLVSNGSANKVFAVNPADGTTLATLALQTITVNGSNQSINPVGGVYDAVSGHLFLLSGQGGGLVVEVDPATGKVLSQFGTPISINYGGLAIDPVDGNLWVGSSQTNVLEKVDRTGKVVQTVILDLVGQGIDHELSGLAFTSGGQMVASSNRGMVYLVKLASTVGTPTITSINGSALDGTPAQGTLASANVGQIIELRGTNFTGSTRVIFPTRDNNGQTGTVVVTPNVVSSDGTRLQVTVPDQATTGAVTLNTVPVLVNLGFGGWADAIYRGITLSFTAQSTTAAVRFADGGLQGLNDESWGIDNVVVTPAGSPGTVIFSDDFEAGAKPQWSSSQTDGSEPAFTRFSGRFSNGSQTLSLSGLTAGSQYTVKFDFYAIDSWDGDSVGSYGPDYFIVSADNQILMKDTFANFPNDTQSFRGFNPGSVALQVVPVISGMNGRPGGTDVFALQGSGFMEGASTIQVGGVVFNDVYTNTADDKVSGQRNSNYNLRLPLTLEGAITVTTAGGSSTWAGPVFGVPAFVNLSGIAANAAAGVPVDLTKASANPGQTIVLSGNGFTSNTLVQFEAVDSTGAVGTLTRTGYAADNGTHLSVVVPGLARTGQVRVVGASTSVFLQVVPTLRSSGGALTAGQPVILEGSGLIAGALTVNVDGQAVSGAKVTAISDAGIDQQVVDLTVPAGVSAGLITVSTAGGSFSLQRGVTIGAGTDVTPATDVGDTLAAALAVAVPLNTRLNVFQKIGDNAFGAKDVDVYSVTGTGGDVLTLDVARLTSTLNGTYLRLFDSNGNQLAADSSSGGAPTYDSRIANFVLPGSGTYYVGVSSAGNYSYDPKVANSGTGGSYTGDYKLSIQRLGGGSSSLSGLVATAAAGTAARAGVAAANPGQTITVNGSGLSSTDQIIFETRDGNGTVGTTGVGPASVAADGTNLTVVVPAGAASGMVRLGRESAGLFLQVVPTLASLDQQSGVYHNGYLRLRGSGFMDGALTVNFGSQHLSSSGVYGLPSAGYYYNQPNDGINLTVPNGVPFGPISVTTLGGTSPVLNVTLSKIVSTATSGTPANAAQASANPAQTITLQGSGFDTKTALLFLVVDGSGNISERILNPATVAADGTALTVVVPNDAITGVVGVVGDKNNTQALLQVVPVVTSAHVTGPDGVQLKGKGFVKGNNSVYAFGGVSTIDVSNSPEGFSIGYSSQPNDTANLALPISGTGNLTVTTAGGTSAPIAWNVTNPDHSTLYGTAVDATGGVWVANSTQIYRVDPTTGQTTASFSLPGGNSNNIGLQIVPAGLTLAGTVVPAGSLLVTNGAPNPDKIFALNSTTGAIIATLTLAQNFDPIAGLFDSASGDLFILHSSEVVVINPADGSTVSKFASPIGIGVGGLAIDPATGNLWIGSSQGNTIALVTKTGSSVRTVDLTAQGINQEISGLAFNSAGQLLVSSTRGVIYLLSPP